MIAWKLLKKELQQFPINPKYNESELSVALPGNAVIELRGADNEDALRGAGLDAMVIDEFASIYDNWSVWHEVLRPALTDKKGWVLFIGTPKGKDAFFELYLKGQKREDNYRSWQFTTLDNPFIDPKEIDEARRTMPQRYFRQEYEASFEDFKGLIYPEFSQKDVILPIDIPENWETTGAIDPAVTGRSAALAAAIDKDDNIYIIDEYYELDKRASEIAGVIRDKAKQWYIDPDAKKKVIPRDGKLFSFLDELNDYGLYARIAENDVDGGINRVGEYLKRGKIKIFRTCRNLLWEIERYHWAEHKESIKGESKPVPYKKNDHLMDCLRYIIMSRPSSGTEPKKKLDKMSVAYEEVKQEMVANDWKSKWR